MTVRDIFRAYLEERDWRASHADKKLGEYELKKYARYLTTEGKLAPTAQLPEASYGTFRNWFERIPDIAKVMARDGDEAFHNTQEIISFRDIGSVEPMDYVVMDHRRLDFFCLISERGGWKGLPGATESRGPDRVESGPSMPRSTTGARVDSAERSR